MVYPCKLKKEKENCMKCMIYNWNYNYAEFNDCSLI
jgi:hypothetical protein